MNRTKQTNKSSSSSSSSNESKTWPLFPSIFSSSSFSSLSKSNDANNTANNNANSNNKAIIMEPFDDDKEKDDPKTVNEILSKELFHLSMKDRNDIQEEIHGVHCLAPIETPQMIEESLKDLSNILKDDKLIPVSEKYAYLLSQQQDLIETVESESGTKIKTESGKKTPKTPESGSKPKSKSAIPIPIIKETYVNDINFRLRFLRCELFNVLKAAKRIVYFLNLVLELFGKYALVRPIRLSDFTKEEQKDFRKGRYQFMPFRDRAGRRILCIFPGAELREIPPETHAKIALYIMWAAGYDIHTQRKGLLILAWFDKASKISNTNKKQFAKDHEVATVRACAIHMCTPDTPLYRFRQSVATMRIGHNRKKLKTHLGESVELKYMLQSYGITGDEIPISWSGTVKLANFKKWMRMRLLLEKQVPYHELYYDEPSTSLSSSSFTTSLTTTVVGVNTPMDTPMDTTDTNTNTNITNNPITMMISQSPGMETETSNSTTVNTNININTNSNINMVATSMKMIECPYLNDVVFRQGTSAIGNPGNVTFRSMIESKLNAVDDTTNSKTTTTTTTPTTPTTITTATNKMMKTKRIVHEIMDELKNNSNGRVLIWNEKGWWDVLLNEEQIYLKIEYIVREIRNTILKKKRLMAASTSASATATSLSENNKMVSQITNLNSGTSIFQSQDGITNVTVATTNRIKRQRLNNCSNNANDSSDDDGDDKSCTAVCFGMKFMTW